MKILDNWTRDNNKPLLSEIAINCSCPCCGNLLCRYDNPEKHMICRYTRCNLFGKKFKIPTIVLEEIQN